jgi:hypothetical protein
MPWASFGPFTISGMNGDGQLTLLLGLVLAVLTVRHYMIPGKGTLIWGLVLASLVTVTGVVDAGEFPESAEPGMGLILTTFAGIATIVGFAMVAGDRRSAPVEDAAIWTPPPPSPLRETGSPQETGIDSEARKRWEKMGQR